MGKLPANWRPAHEPRKLQTKKATEKLTKQIVAAIEDGLPVKDAFILNGISGSTYARWRKECVEDMADGFTGTNLIKLMTDVAKADKNAFRRLSKSMMNKAEDGDSRMMMYLADNRFGYAHKRKNVLDVGNESGNNIQINIVDMKGNEQIEEQDDIEEIVVNGVCRDDSNSEEMD